MLALLRTPRWLGFTIVGIVAIIAFGALSLWQWHRAEDKQRERTLIEASLSDAPVDVSVISADDLTAGHWIPATATGRFDNDHQVLVRKRPQNGTNGMWVMTPLLTDQGQGMWVLRGWVAAGGSAMQTPQVPQAPSGQVTVTGLVHVWESAVADDNVGLPPGQVAAAAAETLPELDGEVIPAILQASTPGDGLVAVPVPQVDEGRNISYAIQWLLFAVIVVAGWFYFLRREAKQDQEQSWTSA